MRRISVNIEPQIRKVMYNISDYPKENIPSPIAHTLDEAGAA